jgi:16S rRNA processing protein RimM
MPPKIIPIGKVLKSVGLKGRFKIGLFTKNSGSLSKAREIFLARKGGLPEPFSLEEVSVLGGSATVTVKGIESREDAMQFIGSSVQIDAAQLPKLGPGEYYSYELTGCRVYTSEGRYVGELTEIFSTGANDVFVIKGEKKEHLIPAIDSVVVRIDSEGGRIIIDSSGGLLDD